MIPTTNHAEIPTPRISIEAAREALTRINGDKPRIPFSEKLAYSFTPSDPSRDDDAKLQMFIFEAEADRAQLAALEECNRGLRARLTEIKDCAEAIHRNINEEKWCVPQDPIWVPTIHAHATVIRQECELALAQTPASASDDLAALRKALLPITALVNTNDSDTLARLTPDSHIVARASGSWMPEVVLTLGHLRELARAARTQEKHP